MPQPVKHSVDVMLDAVRTLVLDGGPAAASARAVCQLTGASSGSVYHRFPRRDDLVAAAWLRAQDRFLQTVFGKAEDGVDAAVAVLAWCRDEPDDARLLLRHALRDLLRGDVSPALAERARKNQHTVHRALKDLSAASGMRLRDVTLAVVDLPYTVARRALHDGVPTDDDIASLRRAVALLMGRTPIS